MANSELRTPFGRLLSFLAQLEELKIHYALKHVRDSINFEDGAIEVELLARQAGIPCFARRPASAASASSVPIGRH